MSQRGHCHQSASAGKQAGKAGRNSENARRVCRMVWGTGERIWVASKGSNSHFYAYSPCCIISAGKDVILTIVDHCCSQVVVFLPCSSTITGVGIAQLYFDNVYRWFGLPNKVISDRDP